MKIPSVLILAVVGAVALICFFLRQRKNRTAQSQRQDEVFIATRSQSEARARSLLPTNGSEDRRDLLKPPELPAAPASDGNYRPDPKVNWVVGVTFLKPTRLEKPVLLGGFDQKWMQQHGQPELFGKAVTDGHWTYVRAGGSPNLYTELTFAWRLIDDSDEAVKPVSAPDLAVYLKALKNRVSVLGDPDLNPSASVESAAATARSLADLKTNCDQQAIVVLKAPPTSQFEGRKIWDVMMSLGLKWGDMDIFHWANDSEIGDDSFFSVWTSTPPGYFLPEHIAADRVRTADLIFGFSIPRCAAPQSVFSSMVKAAEYARQRLGGELLDRNGRAIDPGTIQKEMTAIEQRLKAAGFQPGRDSTLYLF